MSTYEYTSIGWDSVSVSAENFWPQILQLK